MRVCPSLQLHQHFRPADSSVCDHNSTLAAAIVRRDVSPVTGCSSQYEVAFSQEAEILRSSESNQTPITDKTARDITESATSETDPTHRPEGLGEKGLQAPR